MSTAFLLNLPHLIEQNFILRSNPSSHLLRITFIQLFFQKILIFIVIGFFSIGFLTASIQAQKLNNLKILSYSSILEQTKGILTLNNAILEWQDIQLEAGEIRLDLNEKKLTAKGFVRFTDSQFIAIMDRLEIDLNTEEGVFHNVVLFDATTHAYLTAEEVRRTEKYRFVAKNCTITTCDPPDPAWTFRGDEVDYQVENFASTSGVTLYIKDFPVFIFPILFWPTTTKRQSGFLFPDLTLLGSTEGRFNLGWRTRVPYFLNLSEDQNLVITANYFEFRGTGIGLDYDYTFREGSSGHIGYFHIREENEIPLDDSRDNKQLNRYGLNFNHNESIDPQTRFILSGQLYSDAQFQREYNRSTGTNYSQQLSTNLTRQFEKGGLNISADRASVYQEISLFNQKIDETRVQSLPAVSANYNDNPWSIPLTLDMNGNATRFYRDAGLIGWREIVTPSLRYRPTIFEPFNLILGYGRRYSDYQVYNTKSTVVYTDNQEVAFEPQQYRAFSYDIGFFDAEVNTSLSRIYVPDSTYFSRFKHTITPRVLYNFVEDVNQDVSRDITFTKTGSSTTFFDGADSTVSEELLTFRLDNVLLAKRYLLVRPVKLTEQSLNALKKNGIDEDAFKKLESIVDKEFSSESEFLTSIKDLTPGQEDLVLSYAERGTPNRILRNFSKTNPESSSSVLSTLNLIQRYNLLNIDENREFDGPTVLEDGETERGDPLLPLIIEWSLTPIPNFSVGLFFRYAYQVSHIVETRASISASTGNNTASIQFSNNDASYRTPEGGFQSKTSTLNFDNAFQVSDNLNIGFGGTVNLDESSVQGRRLLQSEIFMNYNCPKCYNINLQFNEQVELVTTGDGKTKEIIDPSIFITITLGEVLTFNQQQVRLNEVFGPI